MGRSQRHRIEQQGVHSDERIGTVPTKGTYNGSHIRPQTPPTAAASTTRGRAGEAQAANGLAGAGTHVGGYAGTAVGGVATASHVEGSIAPVYKRALAGNATVGP